MDADLDNVSNGNGRYGTHSYRHSLHDRRRRPHAVVYVKTHTMKVTRDGPVSRTLSIDAGSPDFPDPGTARWPSSTSRPRSA